MDGEKGKGVTVSLELKALSAPQGNNFELAKCSYEGGESSNSHCVCCICKDAKPKSDEDMIGSSLCSHYYCRGCLQAYIGEKMRNDIGSMKCPVSDCDVVFVPTCFRTILPEEVFHRWMIAVCEATGLLLCPFVDCMTPLLDNGKSFPFRRCPGCGRFFCADCNVPWHEGMSCSFFQLWVNRWDD